MLRRAAEPAELGVEIAIIGPPSTLGDAATAALLAAAAGQSAYRAVLGEVRQQTDAGQPYLERAERARQRVTKLLAEHFNEIVQC